MSPNDSNPMEETRTYETRLVIIRVPEGAEKVARLEELDRGFGTGPSWEQIEHVEFCPLCDGEVANVMILASVESLTDEQYQKCSEVIVPSGDGHWDGFSREEKPPLDWIKLNFIEHIAVAQYWRVKKSDDERFTEES